MINQKVLELSEKQNLEELLGAINSTNRTRTELIIYSIYESGKAREPIRGYLRDTPKYNVTLSTWNSTDTVPLAVSKDGGGLIVRIDAIRLGSWTTGKQDTLETIYQNPEAWKLYNASVEQIAKEAIKSTLKKYLSPVEAG